MLPRQNPVLEGPVLAPRQDDASGTALYGLIRLGGMFIAIPAEAIREVVPRPQELEAFPALMQEISGAVALRGQMIPVLDLELILAPAAAAKRDTPGGIVVIIRHDGLVHGILADSIEGVSALDAHTTGRIEVPGGSSRGQLARSTFVAGALAGIVIDPAALANWPDLPMVADNAGQGPGTQSIVEPTLIFRIGGLRCALPAACVDASLPEQKLLPAPLDDNFWIAMLRHNGVQIPAIDTLSLLKQGDLGGRTCGGAIVVRTRPGPGDEKDEFGLVALLIDNVDDIVRLTPDMVAPLSGELADVPFISGVLDLQAGPCLMMDAERLIADSRLIRLGRIKQDDAGDEFVEVGPTSLLQTAASGDATLPEAHLVFETGGGNFAAPLVEIDEIMASDGTLITLDSPNRNVLGLISRRGCAVPVIDLDGYLGASEHSVTRFIIIARVDRPGHPRRIGFAVNALRSVEKAAVQTIKATTGNQTNSNLGLLQHTLRLADGSACSVLDLSRLAIEGLATGTTASAEL